MENDFRGYVDPNFWALRGRGRFFKDLPAGEQARYRELIRLPPTRVRYSLHPSAILLGTNITVYLAALLGVLAYGFFGGGVRRAGHVLVAVATLWFVSVLVRTLDAVVSSRHSQKDFWRRE